MDGHAQQHSVSTGHRQYDIIYFMATLDTRPQVVDITHYAGDTLPLRINTSDDFSTAVWSGEVRLDHADATPDATFSFTPDTGGALAILSDTDTAALNALGLDVTENGQTFKRYTGIYDIQVDDGMVRTLVRGKLTIDEDVTRV